MALKDAEDQTILDMERVKKRIGEVLKVPIHLSNSILLDKNLKQIVNTDYETIYGVVEAYSDYNAFSDYRRIYSEIANIRFYIDNQTLINNWEIIPAHPQVQEAIWYSTVKQGKGVGHWFYIEDETNKNKRYLSLVRKIDYPDYKTNGVLVINVNTSNLQWILSQEITPTMLVDQHNRIIATNQSNNHIGFKLNDIVDSKHVVKEQTNSFQGIVKGELTQIYMDDISVENSLNDMKVVSFVSNKSISESADYFNKIGLTVILVSVSTALLLIYYLSKLLSNRLLILNEQVNQVGKGNFDTPILIDGDDEIGQLARQLKLMAGNTKELLEKVHQSNEQKALLEKKQNKIKFKMMASQINPHFLFNALESIRMKAHLNGESEIARIVKLLGKLMRNSIEVGTGKVMLKSEVEVVRYYLEIQSFRFQDRLSYEFNIDPLANEILIPPLIIQPLVENSVIHGLENSEKGGKVYVKVKIVGEDLLIQVTDSGLGISSDKKAEINKTLYKSDENEGDRIGLRNVHQRLQLLYGTTSGLNIESEIGIGTKISFLIPYMKGCKDV